MDMVCPIALLKFLFVYVFFSARCIHLGKMENLFQPWIPKFVESAWYPCGIPPRPTLSYLPLFEYDLKLPATLGTRSYGSPNLQHNSC